MIKEKIVPDEGPLALVLSNLPCLSILEKLLTDKACVGQQQLRLEDETGNYQIVIGWKDKCH